MNRRPESEEKQKVWQSKASTGEKAWEERRGKEDNGIRKGNLGLTLYPDGSEYGATIMSLGFPIPMTIIVCLSSGFFLANHYISGWSWNLSLSTSNCGNRSQGENGRIVELESVVLCLLCKGSASDGMLSFPSSLSILLGQGMIGSGRVARSF